MLPLLPAGIVEYTFTDLSPLFLERAAHQFDSYNFVEWRVLDIERSPVEQGFDLGRYDVVIAANVLHACADLRVAVTHARDLLAPSGLLLLLEGLQPQRWVDLSFGLTDGWWRFSDAELRPSYPLIDRGAWHQLLGDIGFTDLASVPEAARGSAGVGQQALIVARAPMRPRRWSLLGGPRDVAEHLTALLRLRGDTVTCLTAERSVPPPAADHWIYLDAIGLADATNTQDRSEQCAESAVARPLGALAQLAGTGNAGKAWLVTQGAHSVQGQVAAAGRWQAPLWGVGRVFALEHPTRWGGLVDLPPDVGAADFARTLLDAIDSDDGEDQSAWRHDQRFVCRLIPAPMPTAPPLRLRTDATYLITGGFGGLGLLVARWLVEHGAQHVALLGRRPNMSAPGVRAIVALGAQVIGLAGDVADRAALQTAVAQIARQAPPVRGVLHLAAEFNTARISELTVPQIQATLRPKLAGTLALEELARAAPLDFLVLFSSTTALLGAAGLAHYAAANLFLDATAEQFQGRGTRLLSVNWGTWEAMRLASQVEQQSFREAGLEPMGQIEALSALGQLMSSGATTNAVLARVDWAQLKALHEARRERPLLRRLGQAPVTATHKSALDDHAVVTFAQRIAAAPARLRLDLLIEHVQQEVARVLALPDKAPVAPTVGLFDLGMDSLMAVELKRRLERSVGFPLPSTLTFNYPNACALAGFLESQIMAAPRPPHSGNTPARSADTETVPATVPADLQSLDELSEEELEMRLKSRLDLLR